MSASGDVAQDPWSPPGPGPGTGVATVPDAEALRRPSDSPLRTAMRRLRRNKMAMVCLGIVIFFVLIAIFADLLTKLEGEVLNDYHLDLVDDYGFPRIGPTSDHWFGVQPHDGRDVFARWVYGARPSLIIAFVASLASTFFGVLVGLVSGYLGGRVDAVISWIIDLVLSLPYLLFAVAMVPIIVSVSGGVDNVSPEGNAQIRFFVLLFVLVFFGWAGLARLIRGEVLSLKQREFVEADHHPVHLGPACLYRRRGRAVLSRRRSDRPHPVMGADDRRGDELLRRRSALPVAARPRSLRADARLVVVRRQRPRCLRPQSAPLRAGVVCPESTKEIT